MLHQQAYEAYLKPILAYLKPILKQQENANFTKAAKTKEIKRAYVTESRINSRDLNYPILALFTKARETGDIAITSKKQKKTGKRLPPLKCRDSARQELHKSL